MNLYHKHQELGVDCLVAKSVSHISIEKMSRLAGLKPGWVEFIVLPSVFYFVDGNDWHLGEIVDLDRMVTRKFLSINEVIQLAKHNSIINAHFERSKLKKCHLYITLYTK